MKFHENSEHIIIPKYESVFVYFLIKDDEVVYVGQTRRGLSRPLSHTDKDYDGIIIQYCKLEDLDILEDRMIKKYRPKYNGAANNNVNYSLKKVRNKIRKRYNSPKFSLLKLKKGLAKLNIQPYEINGTQYISVDDYKIIVDYIDERLAEMK